ncbi:hypothetical protein APR11_003645 [Nocardia amikacinitolerans]|nr:hypothetical protein [Nocardia amikacinitolerans]
MGADNWVSRVHASVWVGYDNLTPASQRALSRIYGSTLVSWLDFAGIDHTSEDDNR